MSRKFYKIDQLKLKEIINQLNIMMPYFYHYIKADINILLFDSFNNCIKSINYNNNLLNDINLNYIYNSYAEQNLNNLVAYLKKITNINFFILHDYNDNIVAICLIDNISVAKQTIAEQSMEDISKDINDIICTILGNNIQTELISSFFNSLSHDMKTPLTSIIGSCSALKHMSNDLTKKSRDTLINCAIEESERLLFSINNMLLLTKLENNIYQLNNDLINPSNIINKIISHYKQYYDDTRQFIIEHNVNIDILADAKLIELLINNLVDNAIKYSYHNAIIKLSSMIVNGKWQFIIDNEGSNIAPEHQTKIWDKFFRIIEIDKIKIPGMGLGLNICKHIIDLYSGSISISDSPTNKGTLITCCLNFPS